MLRENHFNFKLGVKLIKDSLKKLPNGSGIYKFIDSNGDILYVGKAKNLRKRVASYSNLSKQSNRIKLLISSAKGIEFIKTPTESDSLILENNLIKKFKPKFNIRLVDDKSYPYIMISSSKEWPQLRKFRGIVTKKDNFFGPFSSSGAVNNILKQIEAAFLLRNCSDKMFSQRKRPCIQYQIKRCSAPCVNLISKNKYSELVNETINFLRGKNLDYKKKLVEEMNSYSGEQNYEKAASLRDRIKALSKISNERYSDINNDEDFDIVFLKSKYEMISVQIFFFRSGKNLGNRSFLFSDLIFDDSSEILEQFLLFFYSTNKKPNEILINIKIKKRELLQTLLSKEAKNLVKLRVPIKGKKKQLMQMVESNADAVLNKKISAKKKELATLNKIKNTFNLKKTPNRIEIFDNSHISGTNPVGAMVVFENSCFQKKSYRKFNIKTDKEKLSDDYFMMQQVFERRFKFNKDWKKKVPDLIIIDGGKGHLNLVQNFLDKNGLEDLEVIAIAKGKFRNDGNESFFQKEKKIKFDKKNEQLFFLQRLRDEAHRFAVMSSKNRHTKSFKNSTFDKVIGLGKKTKSNLLSYFGSIDNIKTASIIDLRKVPGVGNKMAVQIYNEFNKND